jgi:hypothetical protein
MKEQCRIVRLALEDARKLKRLAALYDTTISQVFTRFLGPLLIQELDRSQREVRGRDRDRRQPVMSEGASR